jgi:hypothetical protein
MSFGRKSRSSRQRQRAGSDRNSHGQAPLHITPNFRFRARSPARVSSLTIGKTFMRHILRLFPLLFLASQMMASVPVEEKAGGFKFVLADDFAIKPNPRKKTYPTTQFDTLFSRASGCIAIPSGFSLPSIARAIDASIKLAAEAFEVKVTESERAEVKSISGVPVTRVVAAVEGGDFSFLVIVAFSPTPKSAVTYCFTPGTLSKEEALKLVADMIESLELQKSPRE